MDEAYQYQSFDDAPGLVDSFAKLRAMQFPPLIGKSFFDVACNEGYYCGAALRAGASRVVGLDNYPLAIERARRRFPKAEFLLKSWDDLPNEQFDVVLFASAMHYIDDNAKIVQLLAGIRRCLKTDGLLVLEAGVSNAPGRDLVKVDRPDGSVYYPTWEQLVAMIHEAGFVWRRIGESEPGDNYPRVVMHCRNIRPVVVFVRGRSMSGKSYLANSLANYDYRRVLILDLALAEIFKSKFPEFHVNDRDWPTTLKRAAATLPSTLYAELANSIVRDIMDRSELVAANNVPRQDPIVVDGFDSNNPEYELVFNELVRKLIEGGYHIWDSRLLSPPIEDNWNWYSARGFADCGGFLLPVGRDSLDGAIVSTVLKSDVVEFGAEIRIPDKQCVIGIAIVAAGSGPLANVAFSEPVESGPFSFSIPLKRLAKGIESDSEALRVSRLGLIDLHFVAWTDSFKAYWLHVKADNWLFRARDKEC